MPTQTFRITLTATTTTGDRWRDVGHSTWDFLASVTGMLAAVGGASVFTGAAWVGGGSGVAAWSPGSPTCPTPARPTSRVGPAPVPPAG